MSLEEEILERIRPTPEEKRAALQAADALRDALASLASNRGIPATPLLMGSVAKDTFLREPEIDVFVAFPETTSREDLERWGLELGNVVEGPDRRYAEHPYTHGFFMGYEADVVPCYSLKEPSDRMTAVDRTPFHLEYIRAHLREEQKDQVRLLKQFAKGLGIYGAEAIVQGLSGYLCELLVLLYGTFSATLQAIRDWEPPVNLQLEKEPAREFQEPLVFVDPVDGQRNVASAVSEESLATLILAAGGYVRDPHEVFFFPPSPPKAERKILLREIQQKGTTILALSASAPDQPEDVLYPQLRKAAQSVVHYLQSLDFRVLQYRPFLLEGEWCLILELEVARLPPTKKHVGPPTWIRNSEDFLAKWESSPERVTGPYVEGGRLVVEIARAFTDAGTALRESLSSLSLGKHLDLAVMEGFKIESAQELVDRGHEEILAQFLHRRLPWRVRARRKRGS